MTVYFAFPAGDRLQQDSVQLLANFEQGLSAPQSDLFVRVANGFADVVIQTLLLNMVQNMEGGHLAARIMEKLAGVIKATVHVLIRQTLHKRSNEELRPLLGFVKSRRLVQVEAGEERDYVCFPLPVDLAGRFAHIFHRLDQGHIEEERTALRDAMLSFSELAHYHFYEEPTQLLELGFIARKAASVGGSTIQSGSQSSIKQIFSQLKEPEIIDFVSYFRTMFVEI